MPSNYYDQLQGGQVQASDAERYLLEQNRPKNDIDTMDLLGVAYDDAFVWNAAGRMYDRRRSQFQEESNWQIDKGTKDALASEYREDDYDYLMKARSETEFLARKGYIKEDQTRERKIAEAGGAGITANIAMSLLDPVGIALGVATGGLGYVQKGTKAARIMKQAGMVGAESMALESALYGGNTQSEVSDLAMAFGTGAFIGGGLASLSKARPNAALADEAAVQDADGIVLSRMTAQAEEAGLTRELPEMAQASQKVTERQIKPDTRRMEANTYEYEQSLQRDASKPVTRSEAKKIKREREELQAQIEEINSNASVNQADLQGLREEISTAQSQEADRLSTSRTEIEQSFTDKISQAQARLDEMVLKAQNAKNTRKANAKVYDAQQKLDEIIRDKDQRISRDVEQSQARIRRLEHKLNKELGVRNARAKNARQAFEERASKLEARIASGRNAAEAQKKLKEFRKMTKAQQMQYTHSPEGGAYDVPNINTLYRRNVEALDGDVTMPKRPEVLDGVKAPELGTVTAQSADDGISVGAAQTGFAGRNQEELHSIPEKQKPTLLKYLQIGGSVPSSIIGSMPLGKGVARWIQGLHTYLSNSDSFVIRGLNWELFEAPQGGKTNKVTAAVRSSLYQRKIRAAQRYRMEEGFESYAETQGFVGKQGYVRAQLDRNLRNEFHKKVMLEARYPKTYGDEGIQHAAAGVREQFQVAGQIRKEAGEGGFENIDLDANYVTSVVDGGSLVRAVNQHGREKVKEALSQSYQRGGRAVRPENADLIAEAYIQRAIDNTVSTASSFRRTTGADVEDLRRALEDAGVDKNIIEDFLESTEKSEIAKHMSDRARMSLEPDLRVEVNGLSVIDLFDTNLPKLLESYTIDAAGGASMAKMGFKTRQQFDEFLKSTHQHMINQGINPAKAQIDVDMIREGVDMLYGRSINKYAKEGWSRNLSRLRDVTALLRLQMVGLSAIPETARMLTNRGIKNTLREVPAAATLIRGSRAQREGGKFSGALTDPELRELDEILQYAGEDHILIPNNVRAEAIEEMGGGGIGARMDQWLAQGRRIQELTSFFRTFQGGGEKIAARSINRNLKRWMYDDEALNMSTPQINDAGWSDGFLEDMKQWVKDNPLTDNYDGKIVNVLNLEKMPLEMRERYTVGVYRLASRDMQRAMVGETPTFMHKLLGQTLTQFRSFSITSLDKQLIHDIKHDQAAGALIMAWSSALGLMVHSVSGVLNGQEETFSQQNMLMGTWNRMGQMASLGIAADGLATLNLLPDSMMAAPNRYGFRSMGLNSVPVVGLSGDVKNAYANTADYILSSDSDYGADDILNQWQKIIPFAKSMGVNQAFNKIEEEIE